MTMSMAEVLTAPGKILFSLSAAHAALGFPPSRQSSNSNNGWRTGFEKDTRAESTKVMVRTPQPFRHKLRKRRVDKVFEPETYHQCAGNVAPKRTSTEQETPCTRDSIEVQGREDAPAHELEVQVHRLVRQSSISQSDQPPVHRCMNRRAHRFGSIIGARSAIRGPSFPCTFFSQPTAPGFSLVPALGAHSSAQ